MGPSIVYFGSCASCLESYWSTTPASAEQLRTVGSSLARLGLALQGFDHPRADRMLLWDLKHFRRMRPLLDYVDEDSKRVLAEEIFDEFDAR